MCLVKAHWLISLWRSCFSVFIWISRCLLWLKLIFFLVLQLKCYLLALRFFSGSLKSYNVLGIVQHEIRLVVEIESGCSKIKDDGDLSNIRAVWTSEGEIIYHFFINRFFFFRDKLCGVQFELQYLLILYILHCW